MVGDLDMQRLQPEPPSTRPGQLLRHAYDEIDPGSSSKLPRDHIQGIAADSPQAAKRPRRRSAEPDPARRGHVRIPLLLASHQPTPLGQDLS